MIYTVTFNPSVDYFLSLNKPLAEGVIAKATTSRMVAGGKGVNISIVLSNQGIESKAVMFLGGFTGDFIEKQISDKNHIEVIKVPINENNRINVKVNDPGEMAINAIGPTVNEEEKGKMLKAFENLTKEDIVVISGSFCNGVDASDVKKISYEVKKANAKLILDIPNLTFEDLSEIKPYLIKPNMEELSMIFKCDASEDYQLYVEKLIKAGVENVVLSIGAPGSFFQNNEVVLKVKGPEVEVKSTVGCGDSMLAFIISALNSRKEIKEMLALGEAAGRCKAASYDLPTIDEVDKMLKSIVIEDLS